MVDTYLIDERHADASCRFRLVFIEAKQIAVARFSGPGTMAATQAFVRGLENSLDVLPNGDKVNAIADLTNLTKTPIRAQFILGKWLFTNRARVGRIAIYGAAAWERRLARAVFKMARLKDISFFKTEAEARQYMDFHGPLPEV